ncbi:uncharacterized protein LOC133356300 isoform X2 [Lethenteron reissneri]|uniref:uncharacterized protein LOC133356300 isoform X2 n=1 Tax=Lethenteron reissneri TaxID=7753 RepID=UPI002AB6F6DD|nr:uncharacterized protein LOC133356300 isoform X2 [Lethenteron reissneri]
MDMASSPAATFPVSLQPHSLVAKQQQQQQQDSPNSPSDSSPDLGVILVGADGVGGDGGGGLVTTPEGPWARPAERRPLPRFLSTDSGVESPSSDAESPSQASAILKPRRASIAVVERVKSQAGGSGCPFPVDPAPSTVAVTTRGVGDGGDGDGGLRPALAAGAGGRLDKSEMEPSGCLAGEGGERELVERGRGTTAVVVAAGVTCCPQVKRPCSLAMEQSAARRQTGDGGGEAHPGRVGGSRALRSLHLARSVRDSWRPDDGAALLASPTLLRAPRSSEPPSSVTASVTSSVTSSDDPAARGPSSPPPAPSATSALAPAGYSLLRAEREEELDSELVLDGSSSSSSSSYDGEDDRGCRGSARRFGAGGPWARRHTLPAAWPSSRGLPAFPLDGAGRAAGRVRARRGDAAGKGGCGARGVVATAPPRLTARVAPTHVALLGLLWLGGFPSLLCLPAVLAAGMGRRADWRWKQGDANTHADATP